ncbi:MAG: hypothetical protein R3281_01950 [Balneolaceae bacterium]|nr:hypothetical protein [Balneolaceae bacterium]
MPFTSKMVKFEIPNISHGLKKANGILRLVDDYLELEFQEKDALVELFKSDVKVRRIPLCELESVEYKKGWFSAKILLEAGSMKVLEEIPGSDHGSSVLKVDRKEKDDARDLVSKIRLKMSELKLQALDDEDE